MIPDDIVVLESSISKLGPSLFAIEESAIEHAVGKRQDEFRTGRKLARQALERLNTAQTAIPSGPNREPIWPAPIVGSISHSASHCVVAAAMRSSFRGIGIDIEPDSPLPAGVVEMVLTEEESRWHQTLNESLYLDTLSFSAKESIFKCLFPCLGFYFDFKEVSLQFDLSSNRFTARLAPRIAKRIQQEQLQGVYWKIRGHLLSLVYLETST